MALKIVAEHGPSSVTIASITSRLDASTGSFYHRFASRDLLLAQLRLRIEADLEHQVDLALEAGEPLRALLCTLDWVRAHPAEARLLLLYSRSEFFHGEWPQPVRDSLASRAERAHARLARFAGLVFRKSEPDDIRCAQFLLTELPAAAVMQHVCRHETPPQILDQLVTISYRAIVAAYRAGP